MHKCVTRLEFILTGKAVDCKSQPQPTIVHSTADEEYTDVTESVKMVLHLWLILDELGVIQNNGTVICIDNVAAVEMKMHRSQHATQDMWT